VEKEEGGNRLQKMGAVRNFLIPSGGKEEKVEHRIKRKQHLGGLLSTNDEKENAKMQKVFKDWPGGIFFCLTRSLGKKM